MREILAEIAPWFHAGEPFALATVVQTWSSAPRPVGAAMAVSQSGEAVGSVSGGCVEGAVYEVAQAVLASGDPQLVTYGVGDDDAFAVGLTCGGTIQLFVSRIDAEHFAEFARMEDAIAAGAPIALATVISTVISAVIDGPGTGAQLLLGEHQHWGSLGSARLDAAVIDDGRGMLEHGSTGILTLGADGERRHDDLRVLVQTFAPPPRMIVFGAIDFAAAVARVGSLIGYRVTVCDARPVFATRKRFPDVHEVIVEWPHRYLERTEIDDRTVICVLTHDPKFDIPLLALALRTHAAYVGAMGSRRTHDDRMARLREEGLTEVELARLSSPIGLDLGARTPQETAISIAAEIIASVHGGSGRRLTELDAPIHRAPLVTTRLPL
ncbi:XdhC family protein [Naasia lichenicola]|uniref:XdhC family protein n=1 Tax=Naasia lichenicola TaxID=2565933 RepID=A0A4S4FI21_9MICO|nr:XdhC/CoxI family protein [Naasia lichenicola]THG28716.1 XdhC family protein [Naasia lichenicola]